jgi:hypothetical protein
MKLSSIITTAAQLGLVMSTAIPAITTPEENSIALREAELIGAQDANGIDKREVFTWDKIPVATACVRNLTTPKPTISR